MINCQRTLLFIFLVALVNFSYSPYTNVYSTDSAIQDISQVDFRDLINQLDIENIRAHVQFFTDLGSRANGYPGYDQAAQYIYSKFKEYNLVNVSHEYYDLTVPLDYGGNITIVSDGAVITAYPLEPNLVETCTTPPNGVEGPLVYVGNGMLSEYTSNVNGSIVLMDFSSRDRWLKAASLGAKAIIFMEDESYRTEALGKSSDLPIDIPRLYISKQDGIYLSLLNSYSSVIVNVKSHMQYKKILAKNIVAFLPGTDLSEDVIVLSAHFDSGSFVPSLSPGAQDATGIATLLELARIFSQPNFKPRRSILFVALSGHHIALSGAREFVYSHLDKVKTKLKLFISIDLSTHSDTVGIFYYGYFFNYDKPILWYETLLRAFIRYVQQIESQGIQAHFENHISTASLNITSNDIFTLDSEPFTLAGGLGLTYYTVQDPRHYFYTPCDTYDKLNFNNLRQQVIAVVTTLFALINDPELNISYYQVYQPKSYFSTINGRVVEYNFTTAWYSPVQKSLVCIERIPQPETKGRNVYNQKQVVFADDDGFYTYRGALNIMAQMQVAYMIQAFVDSPSYGSILYAPDMGVYSLRQITIKDIKTDTYFVVSNVFKCGSAVIFDLTRTEDLLPDANFILSIRKAKIHNLPDFFYSMRTGEHAMVFADGDIEVIVRRGAEPEPYTLIFNASVFDPEGIGLTLKIGQQLRIGLFDSVTDLYLLNDYRLRSLEMYNIFVPEGSIYHRYSAEHIESAEKILLSSKPDYNAYYRSLITAWSFEHKVFVSVKSSHKDASSTAVFLFLLIGFFSVIAERFFIDAQNLVKRLISIVSIFTMIFIPFYTFHSGLHVSNTYIAMAGMAMTIFAFVSCFLIYYRFTGVLRTIRIRYKGSHYAAIERISKIVVSFSIAISNLRRRKLQSELSLFCITIVVFSLLSFSSLATMSIVVPLRIQGETLYEGILIEDNFGESLSENLLDFLQEQKILEVAEISPRSFMLGGVEKISISSKYGSAVIDFVAGLNPQDPLTPILSSSLINGSWLLREDGLSCLVSDVTAQYLKVSIHDTIRFAKLNFTVLGIFNSGIYDSIKDLNRGSVTPVDRTSSMVGEELVHFSSKQSVIVPYKVLKRLGGYIGSVALKFGKPGLISETAPLISQVLTELNLYAGTQGTITLYNPGRATVMSGWQMLIVPLILCNFVIGNFMLGSIYARSREMTIYSSLGLTVRDILTLFLCESLVLSLTGGTLGYINGIIVNVILYQQKCLPPEFIPNLSSSWVILAISSGIGSTLLGLIYPLRALGKMVTPSLERAWKIPTKPVEDRWEIPLPFVCEKEEMSPIMNYLNEFLYHHREERASDFTVEELSLVRKDASTYVLTTIVRLPPYEAGVKQRVEICAKLSEKENKYHVSVYLERISGVLSIWKSVNRNFLDKIRKEFLMWRSLRPSEKTVYFEMSR